MAGVAQALTWCGVEMPLIGGKTACCDLRMGVEVACLGRHLTHHSKGLHRRLRSDQRRGDRLTGFGSLVAGTLPARIRWRTVF